MKKSEYFKFRHAFPDRQMILDEWISRVINSPIKTQLQDDGRMRLWGRIKEANNRYLRVIILEDGKTIHNAFFDRDFKE